MSITKNQLPVNESYVLSMKDEDTEFLIEEYQRNSDIARCEDRANYLMTVLSLRGVDVHDFER